MNQKKRKVLLIVDGRTPEELAADGDDRWPDGTPYVPPRGPVAFDDPAVCPPPEGGEGEVTATITIILTDRAADMQTDRGADAPDGARWRATQAEWPQLSGEGPTPWRAIGELAALLQKLGWDDRLH